MCFLLFENLNGKIILLSTLVYENYFHLHPKRKQHQWKDVYETNFNMIQQRILYEYNCVSKISITSIAIPETEKRITIGDFFLLWIRFQNCTGYSNVRCAFETTEQKNQNRKKNIINWILILELFLRCLRTFPFFTDNDK